jgi:hypothetical protein
MFGQLRPATEPLALGHGSGTVLVGPLQDQVPFKFGNPASTRAGASIARRIATCPPMERPTQTVRRRLWDSKLQWRRQINDAHPSARAVWFLIAILEHAIESRRSRFCSADSLSHGHWRPRRVRIILRLRSR